MLQVKMEEAATRLPQLFEAALRGEEVLITSNGEHSATVQLVPLPNAPRRPQFGSARGMIRISDDFDAPLEEFREYME